MNPLYPDEILYPGQPTNGLGAVSNLDLAALQTQVQKLVAEQQRSKALAYVALGFVGGAIGAKVVKGAVGMVVAGGLAWWAYSSLSKGA